MSRPPLFLTACLAALLSSTARAEAEEKTLTRFDGTDGLRWQTVNDDVMGGRSRGGFELTSEKTLRFSGETSLQNNGGFSSIRTRRQPLELGGTDGLALRVRGDGRTYKVSLQTAGTSWRVSYWADLPTVAGQWTEARIPFAAWVPTSFGRELSGPALEVASIDSVGFMIYDKKAGPFSLEVASIAAYRGAAELGAKPAPGAPPTIVGAAQAAGGFKTLLAAAQAAGLVDALTGPGPLTLFAPTDAAFAALPEGQLAALLEPGNREQLRAVLTYHVVPGDLRLTTLLGTPRVQTLAGQRLTVERAGGAVTIGGATVSSADLACSNGVIHVIDRVLLPELGSLAAVAHRAGTFRTLLAAAKAAGLDEALAGGARLTVFAPTDAAFAALPAGTVEGLLQPANKAALLRVLKHHLVEGVVDSDQALAAGAATTLAGTQLSVTYADGSLRVSGARLTTPDLAASNGVVHVVDSVLLPPPLEPTRSTPGTETAAARAARMIERAIDRGVPLFNAGQQESCRAIYELTATALLDLGDGLLPTELRTLLGEALAASKQAASASEAAWTLRRALDAVYSFLLRA
jgi:transforming growth factor-beta-induced protein